MVRVTGLHKIDENEPLARWTISKSTPYRNGKYNCSLGLLYLPTEKTDRDRDTAQYESEINLSDEQYREALDLVMEKVHWFSCFSIVSCRALFA